MCMPGAINSDAALSRPRLVGPFLTLMVPRLLQRLNCFRAVYRRPTTLFKYLRCSSAVMRRLLAVGQAENKFDVVWSAAMVWWGCEAGRKPQKEVNVRPNWGSKRPRLYRRLLTSRSLDGWHLEVDAQPHVGLHVHHASSQPSHQNWIGCTNWSIDLESVPLQLKASSKAVTVNN